MTTKQLPFDITIDSSANWLQSLSQLSSVNSAHQLNNAVKQLRYSKADETLDVLIQLTPPILYSISDIVSSILAEANKTPRKIEKLCIQLLKNLSLGFCAYANKAEIPLEQTKLAIYFGLQLIGYTQYITTIYHESPSASLWGKTGQLYMLAQSRNIVSLEIMHKIKDFKNLMTIETVLKRNLLFSILMPYQYGPDNIKEMFFISGQHAKLLNLDSNNSTDNNFCWDSNAELPPFWQDLDQKESDFIINIDSDAFLSFIKTPNFSSSLEEITLNRIIDQLSGFRQVMSTSIPVPASNSDFYYLITGFTEITKLLQKISNLNQIQQLSSQIVDEATLNTMSLEPMAYEKSHLSPTPNLADTNTSDKLITNAQTVAMLNTKYNQYIIAYAQIIDCSIGDLVLLCKSGIKPELGIIRQINTPRSSSTTNVLIERTFGTPTSSLISTPKTTAKQNIIIKHRQLKPEVLIEPNKVSKGTKIIAALEKSHSLDNLIDYSPYFMRFHTS